MERSQFSSDLSGVRVRIQIEAFRWVSLHRLAGDKSTGALHVEALCATEETEIERPHAHLSEEGVGLKPAARMVRVTEIDQKRH